MKRKTRLTILIILITFSYSLGQTDFRDGFIITNQNDTINGLLEYRPGSKNYNSCVFRSNRITTEYFPNQIVGYGYFNDKFYSSQIVDGSFVEVLVLGGLNLYKSKTNFLLKKEDDIYELESKMTEVEVSGKVMIQEDNRWKGIVSYLISDCLSNPNSIVSGIGLQEKSLTKMAIRYNKCKNEDFIVFKSSIPWTQVELGASLGLAKSMIKITNEFGLYPYLDDSYSSTDPTIGLVLAISSPRITERISFQSELHFIKSSYSASLVKINGTTTAFHDTSIDLTTASVPVSIKFSLKERKYTIYFQAGANFDFHLSSKTIHNGEEITGYVVNTLPEDDAFEINTNQFGLWGGIGLLKSYKKFNGSMAIRYFKMFDLTSDLGLKANISRISINLIVLKR